MCGITGLLQKDPVREADLRAMCATIHHRGPDHTGVMVNGGVGLGMTRLAILDLARGNQPMASADGNVTLIFNGEIYNFRELRRELEPHHSFDTDCDTEVVLKGYLTWGEDVFSRLNGIFALALWDARTEQLLLARDPMGVKPLYYCADRERFSFASELKVFTQAGLANTICPLAVQQYLHSSYPFHPHTALEGVLQVTPGCLIRVDNTLTAREEPFYTLPRAAFDDTLSEDDAVVLLRESLTEAVLRQTVSDVPIGLLLSSGLDSMFVLAALKNSGQHDKLKTFTLYYDNPSFSEHEPVQEVTRQWGIANHQMLLKAEQVAAELPKVCYAMDNLDLLPTSMAIYFVSKMAGQHGKVVLAGNGGDELFFGYPTHKATLLRRRLGPLGPLLGGLRGMARWFPPSLDYLSPTEKLARFLNACGYPEPLAHVSWRHVFTHGELARIMPHPGVPPLATLMAPQTRYFQLAEDLGYRGLDRLSIVDLRTWMMDNTLVMWDKAGMNASLEIRVPFLDLDFVRTALSVPPRLRQQGIGNKGLFRKVCRGVLPDTILNLPKHGFQAPVTQWLRGPLQDDFKGYTAALPASHFDQCVIQRLWQDFTNGRRDHGLQLWLLGCLAVWADTMGVKWD